MKLLKSIKNTMINIGKSIERFPITVILSSILVILLIILNEQRVDLSIEQIEDFSRLNMIVGLGVILSTCIGLLTERFFYKNKVKGVISYAIGVLALVLYYFNLLPSFEFVSLTRFTAVVISLIIAFFFIPWLKKREGYETYVIKVFSSFLTTFVYSGVLYFGLAAILLTTNTLFDLQIDGKYYYYIFLVVSLIFAVALFLSKIPGREDTLEDYTFSRSLKVLLLNIVIPLITIYTLILYAYFAKIIIQWQWPKGLVSHLVLWYSAISVGVIFLITPIVKDNTIGRLFKTWFPKLIIPILAMMFISIGLRINQYGITENRYYVVLLGIWITGIMLYFSFVKPLRNIIIPISLFFVVAIAVFGPLSSYSLSIKSQNNRFNEILSKNQMLSEDKILKNTELSTDDKRQLSSIITYFNDYHDLDDLKVLPDNFNTSKMEDVFGFKHISDYDGYIGDEYFYYNLDVSNMSLDIDEYNYYVGMDGWQDKEVTLEDFTVKYNDNNHQLLISYQDSTIYSNELDEYVTQVYQEKKDFLDEKGQITDPKDVTFDISTKEANIKLILVNINGRNNPDLDELTIENLNFILLIGPTK